MSTSWCKKDITPLLTHRSFVFLALTHGWCSVVLTQRSGRPCLHYHRRQRAWEQHSPCELGLQLHSEWVHCLWFYLWSRIKSKKDSWKQYWHQTAKLDFKSHLSHIIFPFTNENLHIYQHVYDCNYRKTSYISRTLVGNKIVDNSDVVGASPVGAAPTTSSFST